MTRMVLAPLLAMTFAAASALMPCGTLSADVLLIEEVRQSERMEVPTNGLRQAEVRARWGQPVTTHAAVGDPPIARWDYDGWSVYFEYDLVLFTVLHRGQVIDKNGD